MDLPHTITELAKKRLHELSQGLIDAEHQPAAAAILEQYIRHLMSERVYRTTKAA